MSNKNNFSNLILTIWMFKAVNNPLVLLYFHYGVFFAPHFCGQKRWFLTGMTWNYRGKVTSGQGLYC